MIYQGTLDPIAQVQKTAKKTVRMAYLPQDGATIAKRFTQDIMRQIKPNKAVIAQKRELDRLMIGSAQVPGTV
jgi:polyhydroxyalkanoate synthesis regulator phasin